MAQKKTVEQPQGSAIFWSLPSLAPVFRSLLLRNFWCTPRIITTSRTTARMCGMCGSIVGNVGARWCKRIEPDGVCKSTIYRSSERNKNEVCYSECGLKHQWSVISNDRTSNQHVFLSWWSQEVVSWYIWIYWNIDYQHLPTILTNAGIQNYRWLR